MTPIVRVRPATVADAAAVAEVHVRGWQEAYAALLPSGYLSALSVDERTARWARDLSESSGPDVLVAIEGEGEGDNDGDGVAVVGFVAMGPSGDDDAGEACGEIGAIYVRQHMWSQGAGRRLMAGAESHLRALGYREATLWVLDTNDRARRFYTAAGWQPDGAVKAETIGGAAVTEIRYRRDLD